jgi:hypothetical protein
MNIKEIKKDEKIKNIDNNEIYRVKVSDYMQFYYSNAIGNCKHCYLHTISNCFNKSDEKSIQDGLDRIEEFLNNTRKLTFGVHVTDKKILDILETRFVLIGTIECPTGYSDTFQYHSTFFTNYDYIGENWKENFILNKEKEKYKKIN